MTRLERYYLLSLFGSGNAIPWVQVIQIGTLHLANPQNRKDIYPATSTFRKVKTYQEALERMFKEALENGLIKRVENEHIRAMKLQPVWLIESQDFDYQITHKGDEILRFEQISRAGDFSYYKYFDRTVDSAKKINPDLFK